MKRILFICLVLVFVGCNIKEESPGIGAEVFISDFEAVESVEYFKSVYLNYDVNSGWSAAVGLRGKVDLWAHHKPTARGAIQAAIRKAVAYNECVRGGE